MSPFSSRSLAALLVFSAVMLHPQAVQGQSLTFTTFPRVEGGAGVDDGTGSQARFDAPAGVATDSSGNLYVADSNNSTIRKISPAGAVTTLAGLAGTPGSVDGTGSAARFNYPAGVATDSAANVYVADTANGTIRKISPAGVVTTLAGLAQVLGTADGTGNAARFYSPQALAVDRSGNVYVADTFSYTIRKITPNGEVSTLAGLAGNVGLADGKGSAARFTHVFGVATDASGNVYIADQGNNTIRKISPDGEVTTLAGLGGISGSNDGPVSAARFSFPSAVAVDSGGSVYVADAGNGAVRKISPAGIVTTLGLVGLPFINDWEQVPPRYGVASDTRGNTYITDMANHTVQKITADRTVTTLAGLAATRGMGNTTAPYGIATDNGGNVYVADPGDEIIHKITPSGEITTFAGSPGAAGSVNGTGFGARFSGPLGVATDKSGKIYVADTGNHTIRTITPGRAVTTLAGLPGNEGSTDGTGSAARFQSPSGVAADSSGNVYVADTYNQTIRKITPAREVTTLAGLATSSGSDDGTGTSARFRYPGGLATDDGGNVYVADSVNSTIRKITATAQVSTLAGLALSFGSADGTGSAARFGSPNGLATDSGGNVYVADTGNNTIRRITPAGEVTTLGGAAGSAGTADGTGSAARFRDPTGVAVDTTGNVYVADVGNRTIRVGRPALADVALIDQVNGSQGATRQLDASPQTAISWQWSVIRRPVDSAAILSSSSARNPTFTPDVPGLFTFRLTATGADAVSITTVNLNVSVSSGRRRAVGRP